MMMKCYFCKHFAKNNRFKCDLFNEYDSNLKCSSITGYPEYDEVDESEYKIRKAKLEIKEAQEKSNNLLFNVKFVFSIIYIFIFVSLLIALVVATLIQRFQHPEMTETQLLIWEFQNHPFLIISIAAQLFVLDKLFK